MEVEQWSRSVLWYDWYVEMLKNRPVALEEWINQWDIWWFCADIWWDVTCPFSLGPFWREQQDTIHKTGLRSFTLHMRAGIKRDMPTPCTAFTVFKDPYQRFYNFQTFNWKWTWLAYIHIGMIYKSNLKRHANYLHVFLTAFMFANCVPCS